MLLGNYSLLHKSPAKYTTGTVGYNDRVNWNKPGMMRSGASKLEAVPYGYSSNSAWFLPRTAGGIASRGEAQGSGSFTAAGALGLNAIAEMVGAGDITGAALALVVSAVANLSGSGDLSASIVGKLEAAANLAGSGNLAAAAGALASLVASLSGTGSLSAAPTAKGALSANIKGYGDLTPEGLRDVLWGAVAANFTEAGTMGQKLNSAASGGVDYSALAAAVAQHVVEGGVTLEQALRLILAPLTGKTAGIGTTTETYMAQDGITPRLTVTFDSNGNRNTVVVDGS